MLEKINSIYLTKEILNYLSDNKRLNLVKYSSFKNKIDLSIIDYKRFSGRYIIYTSKNQGKEYNHDNKLLFEGEYLNGERKKGKEYNKNKDLIFEGEYLKGKRWRGKEFNMNGEIFEGEYLNGKKWNGKGKDRNYNDIYELKNGNGKVKKYYLKGELKFEGEYLNGKRWNGKVFSKNGYIKSEIKEGKGFITEYDDIGDRFIFEGEYLNGERNGKGKEYYNNELKFEGEYLNGERNGKGKEYYPNRHLKFEGEYLNGKRYGQGKEYSIDSKLIFDGEYINGLRLKGKEYYKDKLEYEGEFLYNRQWDGKLYDENGNIISEIKNGNGIAKEFDFFNYKKIFLKFEGEYLNGKKNGFGKGYDENGQINFEGEYLDDKKWNGKAKEYLENKIIFDGNYINGKRNGNYKEYYNDHSSDYKLKSEGEMFNDKKWNGKGFDPNNNIVYELKEGNGYVKEYYYNGNIQFEGEYLNGEKNGKGKEY